MNLKAVMLAVAAACVAAGPAPARQVADERFPAVAIVAGEGVAAIVSNVASPTDRRAACPVAVSFIAGDGSTIGASQNVELPAGASQAVTAALPPHASGLVRAVVRVVGDDASGDCAVRTALEIYDRMTNAVLSVVPGQACLGSGVCAATLTEP